MRTKDTLPETARLIAVSASVRLTSKVSITRRAASSASSPADDGASKRTSRSGVRSTTPTIFGWPSRFSIRRAGRTPRPPM
jgi:hypothetical protein